VVEEEATEDAHRIGAIDPIEQPFMATPIWVFFRARAPWLVILFVVQFLSGPVLQHYSAMSLASVAMLMWFVPLIASSGGNAGSQSATLIVRAMAVGEVEPRDALRILGRETLIGLSLGLTLGVLGGIRVMLWGATSESTLALAIGCSVMVVVVFGALIGAGIPLLLSRFRIDPAVSSTPFVASVVDIGGLILYFEVARLILA
jgi:magnesium transporter